MVKVYLNNTELSDEPIGIDSLKETIQYDRDKLGVIKTFPIELYFAGQGYEIIYNYIRDNGFLFNLPFELKSRNTDSDVYTTYFTGYIRLASCEFLNYENDCKVKAFVVDANTLVKINNNRNIKVNLSGTKSKNGVDITPLTVNEIKLFDSSGSYNLIIKKTYNIADVLRFIIAYISDNEIQFASDLLENETAEGTRFAIGLGVMLRMLVLDIQIELSLDEVLREIYNKFNTRWDIYQDVYGNYVFRLESQDYYREDEPSVSLNGVDDVTLAFDNTSLFSQITFGGPTIINESGTYALPPVTMIAFNEESYTIQNDVNTAATLDLMSKWYADTNILDLFQPGTYTDDTYDRDIFWVEYVDASPFNLAYKNQYYGVSNSYFYNYNLLNLKVVERFQLSGTLVKYLSGNDDNNFYGYKGTNTSYTFVDSTPQTIQLKHDVELLDTNGNYNPATGRYTAPFNGLFGFDLSFMFHVDLSAVPTTLIVPFPKVYTISIFYKINGSNTTVIGGTDTSIVDNYDEKEDYYFSKLTNVYLESTDYIEFFMTIDLHLKGNVNPQVGTYTDVLTLYKSNQQYLNVDYLDGKTVYNFNNNTPQPNWEKSFLGITALSYAGGTFDATPKELYYGALLKFAHPIRKDIWDAIQNNKNKSILVNGIYKGWINNITRDFTTGMAEFELISNIENTF